MASFPFWFAVNSIEYVVLREAHKGLERWQEKEQPVGAGPQSSGSWVEMDTSDGKQLRLKCHKNKVWV